MQVFEKIIIVQTDDLDVLNHVNNVRYVQWIQDIAKEHWNSLASEETNNKYFWVVLSHFIEYKTSAVLGDSIKLRTFVSQSEGLKSTRIVEMYHVDSNKLIVRSETIWCLMDRLSKRPTRITQEIIDLFN